MPPLLSLLLLTGGVAVGTLVLRAFLPMRFVKAAAVTAVVLVGVPLAATLGGRAYEVDSQRRTASTFIERTARQKCLADLSRGDLVGFFSGYIEANVPADATYLLAPASTLAPCIALNLLPRLPVPRSTFDGARVLDDHRRRRAA